MRICRVLPILLFFGCQDAPVKQEIPVTKPMADTQEKKSVAVVPTAPAPYYSAIEQELLQAGLVDVSAQDSTIIVDLRYSTTNNFIGKDVYGDLEKCFLQPDVAAKLLKAQKTLQANHPGYSLIVYDAVRPVRIQRLMWDSVVLPRGEKQKYLSNPDRGSLHNYGAAVDVSIAGENGIPLDMGTEFDFFGEKAHPVKEDSLFKKGELTAGQISNRRLLRSVMRAGGFFGIQTEWWHFNSCRREVAAEKYKIIN
jgi:zinc D-Ala-D-Ala dipeptidase